jgi:hypothetical protein
MLSEKQTEICSVSFCRRGDGEKREREMGGNFYVWSMNLERVFILDLIIERPQVAVQKIKEAEHHSNTIL